MWNISANRTFLASGGESMKCRWLRDSAPHVAAFEETSLMVFLGVSPHNVRRNFATVLQRRTYDAGNQGDE